MNTLEKQSPKGGNMSRSVVPANPIASNTKKGEDAAAIDTTSAFSRAIQSLFARIRPQKVVETGTYLGLGSTLTICEAMFANALLPDDFYSIEVNPQFLEAARLNLAARGYFPKLLQGLSIPRSRLPSEDDIRRETLEQVPDKSIFIDHQPDKRVFYYHKETNFPDGPDDLLRVVLRTFENTPDFIMLDSAGHMGFVEFQYALSLIWKPCHIALDDVYHIKHHRSLQVIQNDPRFRIIELSREKFGYCLAQFNP